MAIINCKECKGSVSTEAVTCPHCGAKQPKDMNWFQRLASLVFLSVLLVTIAIVFTPKPNPNSDVISRKRAAIELCWKDYEMKSNSDSEKQFIARVCELKEKELKDLYNVEP